MEICRNINGKAGKWPKITGRTGWGALQGEIAGNRSEIRLRTSRLPLPARDDVVVVLIGTLPFCSWMHRRQGASYATRTGERVTQKSPARFPPGLPKSFPDCAFSHESHYKSSTTRPIPRDATHSLTRPCGILFPGRGKRSSRFINAICRSLSSSTLRSTALRMVYCALNVAALPRLQ
jgi:hypothetical protein